MRRDDATERDLAIRDRRADLITEVADAMPQASARDLVMEIVRRLNAGLGLVEVELETPIRKTAP